VGGQATAEAARRKELGAFYTPPAMAETLVRWAIRAADDCVMDPSFGGQVFLRAAADRLRELGSSEAAIRRQTFGVELDAKAHALATAQRNGFAAMQLLRADFFSVQPGKPIPLCQAVVGNPPYIRYQEFKQSSKAAHRICEAAGIRLTRLASSWAPFLVHATGFVAPGGRMAQVLPAELLHAQYAEQIIEFFRRRFRGLTIAVFDERVFPGALEEVVLLFAEGREDGSLADVQLIPCRTVADLDAADIETSRPAAPLASAAKSASREKLLAQLLPAETQELLQSLTQADGVARLGTLAEVDIGAVTGANDFFVRSHSEAEELAPELLRPAVSKAAQVQGARYRSGDHERLLRLGRKGLLFVADPETPRAALATARGYLERGRREGIPRRYKCRTRDPWWAVPMPKIGTPDLLLTYCANEHPRLAVNEARVVQTNTIHGVALSDPSQADALAASFYNSFTLLSAELVGRSYGGGVLKLEPTEAEALLVPPIPAEAAELLEPVDEFLRDRDLSSTLDLVDPLVLGSIGLSRREQMRLRAGAEKLRRRRRARGRKPRAS
jgi:adenine-specific DNA-methyltransferase